MAVRSEVRKGLTVTKSVTSEYLVSKSEVSKLVSTETPPLHIPGEIGEVLVTDQAVTADVTAKRTSLGNLRYPRARYPRRYPPNTWFAGNQGF